MTKIYLFTIVILFSINGLTHFSIDSKHCTEVAQTYATKIAFSVADIELSCIKKYYNNHQQAENLLKLCQGQLQILIQELTSFNNCSAINSETRVLLNERVETFNERLKDVIYNL